jgi:hypothetical protein
MNLSKLLAPKFILAYLLCLLSHTVCSKKVKSTAANKNQNVNYNSKGNFKCTEFKDSLDADTLLHVPCQFIRIMEEIKQCPTDSFIPVFLGLYNLFFF